VLLELGELPQAAMTSAALLASAVTATARVTERKVNHLVFGGTSERPGAELRVALIVTAGGKYVFAATVGRFR
jgi:hypothetical protein